MGLAVNMCDEFSMFTRKSSQSIYRFFDILIFDIVVLMLSSCRCNPIILKSILLHVGFLDTITWYHLEDISYLWNTRLQSTVYSFYSFKFHNFPSLKKKIALRWDKHSFIYAPHLGNFYFPSCLGSWKFCTFQHFHKMESIILYAFPTGIGYSFKSEH